MRTAFALFMLCVASRSYGSITITVEYDKERLVAVSATMSPSHHTDQSPQEEPEPQEWNQVPISTSSETSGTSGPWPGAYALLSERLAAIGDQLVYRLPNDAGHASCRTTRLLFRPPKSGDCLTTKQQTLIAYTFSTK